VGGFGFGTIGVIGLEFLLVGLILEALAPGSEALFFAGDFFLEEEVSAVGESSFFRFTLRGEVGGGVVLMGKDERVMAATDDDGTGAGETSDAGGSA
jgi:hypothetical protein